VHGNFPPLPLPLRALSAAQRIVGMDENGHDQTTAGELASRPVVCGSACDS